MTTITRSGIHRVADMRVPGVPKAEVGMKRQTPIIDTHVIGETRVGELDRILTIGAIRVFGVIVVGAHTTRTD
jgi:hypothetical protein